MSDVIPISDIDRRAFDVRYVPILARRSPATVTQSRQASRGEAALSTGRLSEYPTDHYVGICIETSAMAEQNTLRLPRVNFSDCRLRLRVGCFTSSSGLVGGGCLRGLRDPGVTLGSQRPFVRPGRPRTRPQPSGRCA